MGLTRLRAEQISDIDYKQAVRVITVANVTLSGGAPTPVDGVNLSVGDRVLVTGQSTGNQNGIYQVQTVGTGSNGTWIRSLDTNATGELQAGTIVMVTEGTVYADTQWKLTTNNPIIIGTTALTFEQNSAFAFGNIFANDTAVLANSVGSTVTFAAGNNIQISGNNTSKTVTIGVTGISLTSIANGTSNVNVVSSGGNVTVGIGGTSNIAVFSTGGASIAGTLSVSGNITGGNVSGTRGAFTNVAGTLETAAQPNITSVGTLSSVSVSGNVQGGNIRTAGLISATGNITGGNVSATNLTGTLLTASQTNITSVGTLTSLNSGAISSSGNITGANVLTGGVVSATGAITGAALTGTSLTVTTGNITGGNLLLSGAIIDSAQLDIQTSASNSNIALAPNGTGVVTVSTQISAVGNVTGGNIRTTGLISATGNITGANLTINGSAVITGNLSVSGTETIFNVANLTVNDKDIIVANNVTGSANVDGAGIQAGNPGVATWFYNNATLSWQSNVGITPTTNGTLSLGGASNFWGNAFLTTASVTGNVQGGNLRTAGLISATGSVTAASVVGGVMTGSSISVTGTQTAASTVGGVITGSTASLTGNVTGGNISTAGLITATGNITGGNILGNGAGLSGINAFSNITVTGGNSAVADSISDTLTLTAGDGIAIVVDSATDTITIAASGGSEIFVDGADFGTVTEPVTESDDLGLVTDAVTAENDLGQLVVSGLIYPDQFVLPSFTTNTLPAASPAGAMIYVTDESGGAVPAFADGTNWRRVTDRAIVT